MSKKKVDLELLCKENNVGILFLQETRRKKDSWPMRIGGSPLIEAGETKEPGERGLAVTIMGNKTTYFEVGARKKLPYYLMVKKVKKTLVCWGQCMCQERELQETEE